MKTGAVFEAFLSKKIPALPLYPSKDGSGETGFIFGKPLLVFISPQKWSDRPSLQQGAEPFPDECPFRISEKFACTTAVMKKNVSERSSDKASIVLE
ncbi:MAG: hypothetical protein ACYCT5_00475 [Leptospirillum sp.]